MLPVCFRGEIWMLDWNPRRGSEQGGFRPGVIIQCDEGNLAPGARTTILVPLTTQGRAYVFYVPVPRGADTGLPKGSWANCTQVQTVDKERLKLRLGRVPDGTLASIEEGVRQVLGIR